MKRLVSLLAIVLLLGACTSDAPERTSSFHLPDTVTVKARSVDTILLDGSVPTPQPDLKTQLWLDRHGYIRVARVLDTSIVKKENTSNGTWDITHIETQTYAQVN